MSINLLCHAALCCFGKGSNLVDLLENMFHLYMHGCNYPAGIVDEQTQIVASGLLVNFLSLHICCYKLFVNACVQNDSK